MSLERCPDPAAAARWCAARRARGESVGFVPTMGALHEGHLTLVERARRECSAVVVSVFVNPLQFNDPRDFERYPRDLEGDARLLEGAGAHLVFSGTLAQFFPEVAPGSPVPLRTPGPSARGLEGDFRPGHFAGVATICARLFELVRPARAFFGAKDFQQCQVVSELSAELGFPEVVVCPTSRDPDGLARSSRNQLLTSDDRREALVLSRALFAARAAYLAGERRAEALEAVLARELARGRVEVEYAVVRDPARLAETPRGPLRAARALIAARAGRVRLIDNLDLTREDGA